MSNDPSKQWSSANPPHQPWEDTGWQPPVSQGWQAGPSDANAQQGPSDPWASPQGQATPYAQPGPYSQPTPQGQPMPYPQPGQGQPMAGPQSAGQSPQTGPGAPWMQTGGWSQNQPGQTVQQHTIAKKKLDLGGFLRSLFDLGIERTSAPTIVPVLQALSLALAGLAWVGSFLFFFVTGANSYGGAASGAMTLGFLMLVLGWIPALFFVGMVRVGLEAMLALVRSSEDVRVLRKASAGEDDVTADETLNESGQAR
ncbi:DUF4282 domain-containing protein [Aestuariimicrobium kwangyangense]|uniref:DUF4282 domain-containing protein n=1 Tax=Aestuariimicrobium kwangyangense TaxID=396389 RepID=UPI0003B38575|nr:DUF4282 domain-containing protein [Aestuariimicrobium kwangyangense]